LRQGHQGAEPQHGGIDVARAYRCHRLGFRSGARGAASRRRERAVVVSPAPRQHGVRAVIGQRFEGAARIEDACWVAEEEPLTIDVEGVGAYTLMWTPTEPSGAPSGFTVADGVLADGGVPEALALAAGFAFTE